MSHTVHQNWPQKHKFPGSEAYVETTMTNNTGLGLFSKSDNELRSWVNINEFGGLANVQTIEKYERRGYASVLIKEMCKRRAKLDLECIAAILLLNKRSISMFEKIGFVFMHHLRCVKLKNMECNKL